MVFRLPITSLLVFMLVVWRVTHLFWGEDGPFEIFVRIRRLLGQSFLGKLLDCFYCLSLWVAAPFAWWAGSTWPERGLLWFGFSGGAILLERVTNRSFLQNNHPDSLRSHPSLPKEGSWDKDSPPPAIWHETPAKPQPQKGANDVMLR